MSKKGGSSGNQTVTQQNIPDWALGFARDSLQMGNEYTMNPNYRPSTLDRDYSGIRGYNAQGQPNSQVGQFGLSPTPQTSSITSSTPITSGMSVQEQRATMNPEGSMMIGPGMAIPVSQLSEYDRLVKEYATQNPGNKNPDANRDYAYQQIMGSNRRSGRGMGRSTGSYSDGYGSGDYTYSDQSTPNYYGSDTYDGSFANTTSGDSQYDESDSGYDITSSPAIDGGLEFSSNDSWVWGSGNNGNSTDTTSSSDSSNSTNTTTSTSTGETEPAYQFDPTQMTPFTAYDRQRFAAPNANTLTGEGLMAGRYADRFGPSGSDPFASAISSAQQVANYQSGFRPAAINTSGPTANSYNNVNAGLRSTNYGNANQNLQGPINYQGQRSFQQNLSQFENPYTRQVVDQTIKDLDRARRITDMDISSNAARVGAFGGSREALMRSENARNFSDRTAAAVGQLRSEGFQQAANLAQQEQLQRLGLTAQDLQNVRGYASQGNLQGQNLTAQDLQDVRGLISQGALTAQGLGAQSDRDAMNYANQLQMQGNQLNVEQARLAEQFRQGAGALNLQGAGALGNLQQMSIADERQRLADMLAAGAGQSGRDQQDLDFIYSEFNRELDYPGRQIDLRNAAISPATGSIVQTTQPRYQSNPLLGAAGAGLSAYGITKNPYAAGGAALLSLLYG